MASLEPLALFARSLSTMGGALRCADVEKSSNLALFYVMTLQARLGDEKLIFQFFFNNNA